MSIITRFSFHDIGSCLKSRYFLHHNAPNRISFYTWNQHKEANYFNQPMKNEKEIMQISIHQKILFKSFAFIMSIHTDNVHGSTFAN